MVVWQVDVVGAMGVGRVKEEKGVVWHKIEKKVPKVSEEKRFFFIFYYWQTPFKFFLLQLVLIIFFCCTLPLN